MANRISVPTLVEALQRLSLSDLSSLMIEVFRAKAESISPPELLRQYHANRFVKPASADAIQLARLRLRLLEVAQARSFAPLELSPVAPLGSCSAVAKVSQDKVISATRGTEVLADATNLMALHICEQRKAGGAAAQDTTFRYCASHRHVRTQPLRSPGHLAHFEIFCLITGGRDTGLYAFEKESLVEHMRVYRDIFDTLGCVDPVRLTLIAVGEEAMPLASALARRLESEGIVTSASVLVTDNQYYTGVRFKVHVAADGTDVEVADGGFVDWSQKILGSKKERLLISGLGVERVLSLARH